MSISISRWRVPARHKRSTTTRDPATGLMNGDAFDVVAAHVLRRAAADDLPAALLVVELGSDPPPDVAKALDCADVVHLAASILSEETRGEDVLARTGDRELCALLPGYGDSDASRAAARLREVFTVVGAFGTGEGRGDPRATRVGWASVSPDAGAPDADVAALREVASRRAS